MIPVRKNPRRTTIDVGAKGTQIVGKGSREVGRVDDVGDPPGEHASVGTHRPMGELSSENDPLWVQCNKCQKWRRLPLGTDPASVTSDWSCDVNTFQPTRARCSAPEEGYAEARAEVAKDERIKDQNLRQYLGSMSWRLKREDEAKGRLPRRMPSEAEEERASDQPVELPSWVRCQSCGKWRALLRGARPVSFEGDKSLFVCVGNYWDKSFASCSVPQESYFTPEMLLGSDDDIQGTTARESWGEATSWLLSTQNDSQDLERHFEHRLPHAFHLREG